MSTLLDITGWSSHLQVDECYVEGTSAGGKKKFKVTMLMNCTTFADPEECRKHKDKIFEDLVSKCRGKRKPMRVTDLDLADFLCNGQSVLGWGKIGNSTLASTTIVKVEATNQKKKRK